jgi:hypothetical protein
MSKEEDNNSNDSYNSNTNCKLPTKPSPKRKQQVKASPCCSPGQDFNACTVHQVTEYMVVGSPASQQAALGMLENLSSSSNNVSKTIVKSMVNRGRISTGMSQKIAKKLLQAEKLRACA